MTSGTTGPSKLAVNTALHTYLGGAWFVKDAGGTRDDVLLLDLPLFHGAALWFATAALATGTRLAVRSAPSLRNYWEIARDNHVTMGLLLSTMVPFLMQQEPRPAEREHRLRVMVSTPLPTDLTAFKERFGLPEVRTGYGLTEAPGVVVGADSDAAPGPYCGRSRSGYEVRLVDENDLEVAPGHPGQLIVRADHPWMITPEYVADPEATAAAWRNGWFHTGDMLRRDDEGRFFFVDRVTDSMRRRGENISSVEVEAELRAFAGVKEAACVPYRTPDSVEDEVKAWLLLEEGAQVDFEDLLRFAADRLPYFMVPRYFETITEFPLTVSMRVKKFELRARGNGPGCWDREADGWRVTRAGVENVSG
jgi:crotonobetaine/carnitine-CoA ligase